MGVINVPLMIRKLRQLFDAIFCNLRFDLLPSLTEGDSRQPVAHATRVVRASSGPQSGVPPRAETASPAARMFLAAFMSACSVCPQALQTKTAWLSRFSGAQCLHSEQVCDVCFGFTAMTSTGAVAFAALSCRRFLKGPRLVEDLSVEPCFLSYIFTRIVQGAFGTADHVLDLQ